MPILALEIIGNLEDKGLAKTFFLDSQERLDKSPIMSGRIKSFKFETYIVDMKILTPPVYWFALTGVVFGLMFNWFWLWIISLSIWAVSFFFWECPIVTYLGLRRGLKKVGFKGKIKALSLRSAIRRII